METIVDDRRSESMITLPAIELRKLILLGSIILDSYETYAKLDGKDVSFATESWEQMVERIRGMI